MSHCGDPRSRRIFNIHKHFVGYVDVLGTISVYVEKVVQYLAMDQTWWLNELGDQAVKM